MRIRVACPDCGEIHIEPRAVTIRTCIDDGSVTYRFWCPGCGLPAVGRTAHKSAGRTILEGAHFEAWTYPLELTEHRAGPPLTEDDLLVLRALMAGEGWIAELVDQHRRGPA